MLPWTQLAISREASLFRQWPGNSLSCARGVNAGEKTD